MNTNLEIKNKVAESGLVNFDISKLVPKGVRLGLDLKDFLWEGIVLKEKDFREKVAQINLHEYENAMVYVYNSVDAIVPLWAYFLITAKLQPVVNKIIFGRKKDLEMILLHDEIERYNFHELAGKRVLVKGCSEIDIPENAYMELVSKLAPIVKSLMFGEACSNVPILKN